ELIDERDEFLLSRLVDGDLPDGEAEALRRRMERDPELREAFESLARVDELLRARQTDRPAVDQRRFHADVMRAVEAESASGGRLSRWIRIGVPLAAAAAIALFVSFYPFGDDVGRRDAGRCLVRIERPAADRVPAGGGIEVTFKRTALLAEAIRQEDAARMNRPPSVVAAVSPSSTANRILPELPPL
ncbi:MAG: hypothetical protein GY848_09795, partial [Methyloversatilis sp.]|nr:hypothetical protein [Methyloversatilis sp.]